MRPLWLVLSLLAAGLPVATAAPAPPPRPPLQTLGDLTAQLKTAQAAMQKESEQPGGHWQEALAKLADSIQNSARDLSRPGLRTPSLSSGYGLRILVSNLRSAHDPKQALTTIDHLVETVSFLRSEYQLAAEKQAAALSATISHARSREALLEILRRSEFRQTSKPHFFDYYFNRIIVRAMAWLRGIFDSSAMQRAGSFAYVLLCAAYVLVGGAAIWLLQRAWSPRFRPAGTEKTANHAGLSLLSPETHRARAEALAGQGNFAKAVGEYFLMMLSTLEGRDFVPRHRSWTNWEYLRAFGRRVHHEATRDRLGELNLVYDRVTYGGAACDELRFTAFRKRVDEFLSALPSAPA